MKRSNIFQRCFVPAVFSIFLIFGTVLFAGSACAASYEADNIPWSGYWWPYQYGGLATGMDYRGHPAPLEKYLLLTTGGSTGDLIDWYKGMYYDPGAEDWNGLCPYWARSSVWETYDILPSSEDNIVFRVGDKKGLLVLCHDDDMMIKASGSNPVSFHLWLLDYIKDQKKGFTANLDSGDEVWYYPVYGYDMTTSGHGSTESVNVTIYYASDNVPPDYMGIVKRQKTYTYTLTLDSQGGITGGNWTGDSIVDHPNGLGFPYSSAARCPYLDCDEVRRIAQAKDDFLETDGNQPVAVMPGTYHLILLDEDQYIIDGPTGDQVYLKVEKEEGSEQDIDLQISDASGVPVFNATLVSTMKTAYRLTLQNPPYTVTLTQPDYSDPNIYTLCVDHLTAYRRNVPYIPKNGMWSGFALTNAGDSVAEDVMLVTRTDDGSPLQTVFGPVSLEPGEKRTFGFSDLPWRPHEYPDNDSLVMLSDQPVQMINLFAYGRSAMAGFGRGGVHGTHLVIPDTFYTFMGTAYQYMNGAVFNESFVDAPVTFRMYSSDGRFVSKVEAVIPPAGKLTISPGIPPFYTVPDGGWIDIVSTESVPVSGYQYISDTTGNLDALDTLFAMPVSASSKVVPHITDPYGLWITSLTLINPNDTTNRVGFHLGRAGDDHSTDLSLEFDPYEKRVIDLTDEFGTLPGDDLYHSILEITGQHPVAGYYTHTPINGHDDAGYPLLDDAGFKTELVMPHSACSGGWWTGVGLCNPNDYTVQVVMEPYDGTGTKMDAAEAGLTLEAGGYEVFTVRSIFGESASDIAFIKFSSQEPDDAEIGGFYLYGSGQQTNGKWAVDSLSGANM